MSNPYKSTVPVMMVFFNRPEPLKQVFEAVRRARPQKLFLVQDGARENRPGDAENILKCREVVSQVDWECEVHTNYSEENLGCGMRIYSGISWCFEQVDRLMILEDDCVPAQDFFPFCEEVLERYQDDQRVNQICGMNHLGEYDKTDNSYFFSHMGSCWGWATWKRVWDQMEYNMEFMQDQEAMRNISRMPYPPGEGKTLVQTAQERYRILKSGGKLTAWTMQFGFARYLQSQLLIIPRKNLIQNVGLTQDSAHAVNSIRKIPKHLQPVFFGKHHSVQFPLKHPKYMIADTDYADAVIKIMKGNLLQKAEGIARRVVFSDKGEIAAMVKKIPKKLSGKR